METHPAASEAASAVYEAAKTGDIETLQLLIQRHTLILNRLPLLSSFAETPLHVSVLAGHLDFTRKLLHHNPGMAAEFDSSNCLPLHLASAAGHIDIIKALLNADKDACLVPDEDGRIPLHLAAMRGRVDVIREVAIARPESVFVKMPDGDTVLHLCVKFNHLEALKSLVRMINNMGESSLSSSLINLGDEDGNTLLHLAAMLKQVQTTSYLLTSVASMREGEAVNALNKHGLTALGCIDLSPKDSKSIRIRDLLAEASGGGGAEKLLTPPASTTLLPPSQSSTKSRLKSMGKWLKNVLKHDNNWIGEMKEAVLVVATLIASMAFQVANNPPGGVWQENTTDKGTYCDGRVCRAGSAVNAYENSFWFSFLVICNTVAFGASLGVILLVIGGFPIKSNKFFIWLLTQAVCVSLTFITLSFAVAGLLLVSPTDIISPTVVYILLVLLAIWFLLVLVISLLDTLRLIIWICSKLRKGRRGGGGGGVGLV